MGGFQRSWLLLRSSLSIIARNRQLLVFPIVISCMTLVIILFFLAPAVLWPTGYTWTEAEHWQALSNRLLAQTGSDGSESAQGNFTPLAVAYLAFLYFVSMFFATFFNVAFYNEILAALTGQPVSISRGLKFACTKWKVVLMWALFAGLVGLIIKVIEQRLEVVGRMLARFIGLAWSVASVFVIPIIVREEEGVNPVNLLKRSASVLKRTWGETLIGYVGLAFANMMIVFGSLAVLAVVLFASIALSNYWLIAVVGALWLLTMFAWGYLTGVASKVYKAALYLYAAEGIVAEPYSSELLDMAWKYKKS